MTKLNMFQFAETWHEVARFPSELQNGECTATEFTLVDGSFDVVQTSVIDDAQLSTVTTGTLATDGRGVININIDGGKSIKKVICSTKQVLKILEIRVVFQKNNACIRE